MPSFIQKDTVDISKTMQKATKLAFSLVINTSELATLYCLQLIKTFCVSMFFMFSVFMQQGNHSAM